MPDEPGFAIEILVGGQVITVETSAETARNNIKDAIGRPRSGLFGADPKGIEDRAVLHEALSTLATNVLLTGDVSIRTMQDLDGRWWNFRGELIGGVAVIDRSEDPGRKPVGFQMP
jgi:hypothetical protein